MEQLAVNDNLTGLANRNEFTISFQNSVRNNMEQCRNFSLLVLNLDGFEEINNTFGQQSGDLVLTSFAKVLSNCIRYRDQVFRYGADEFTVILNDSDKNSMLVIVDRIQKAIVDNSLLSEFSVSCSIGCANYQKNDDLDSLFERAEQALSRAKTESENDLELSACAVEN